MHSGASTPLASAVPSRPPRKNLLLAATIEADGLKVAVRIRNLSEGGAMLDAAALPRPGTRIVLRRAEIEVGATVIWHAAGKCGIAFDHSAITVEEWVSGNRVAAFDGQRGQARVDAIQHAVRSGAALPADPPTAPAGPSPAELETRIVEEIFHVRTLLDSLGEGLVDDPVVMERHLSALQTLDRASQILDHLGAVLGAEDPLAAAQSVAMQDLRARLVRGPAR